MSGDVQQTLNELERKLRELQAELRAPAADPPRVEEPPRVQEPPPVEEPPPPPAPARNPLQDQLDELLRFRDQLTEAANRLVEDYTRLVEQLERVAQTPPPGGWASSAAGHLTFAVPPPEPPSSEGTLFSGPVVVEAAPFEDIGSLAAFESALRSVPHAEELHVRSFDGGRATFDLRLGGETALVFELRRASDQGFDVEQAEPGRLELAMHPRGDLPPFPMRP